MSTPLRMPIATLVSYPTSPNASLSVIISLSLYLTALLITTFILCYFHLHSNPPPYKCHTSQHLPLMNLPTCPHLTLSPSKSISSPHLAFTPFTPSSSLPLSFSLPLKDSPPTNKISPVSSLFNFSTTSPLPNSSTSEHAQMISLLHLACPFTSPSPCCLD